jgi:hypothetical protein
MTAPKGYVQYDETIEVPPGAGVEGFIRSLREVLKLPNVSNVTINRQGKIDYTFFLREGAEKRVAAVNFDTLMPMALVRNATVQELPHRDSAATVAILQMFRAAAIDHLAPIAFVTGANSLLWPWYEATTSLQAENRGELYGLPVHADRNCPDEVLLLAAAFTARAELVDMHKAYKIDLPTMVSL